MCTAMQRYTTHNVDSSLQLEVLVPTSSRCRMESVMCMLGILLQDQICEKKYLFTCLKIAKKHHKTNAVKPVTQTTTFL